MTRQTGDIEDDTKEAKCIDATMEDNSGNGKGGPITRKNGEVEDSTKETKDVVVTVDHNPEQWKDGLMVKKDDEVEDDTKNTKDTDSIMDDNSHSRKDRLMTKKDDEFIEETKDLYTVVGNNSENRKDGQMTQQDGEIEGCIKDTTGTDTTMEDNSENLKDGIMGGKDDKIHKKSDEENFGTFIDNLLSEDGVILDDSQINAVKMALTQRVAIIQGPPGTGKTFIGVQLVKLTMAIRSRPRTPILVLTYKNHALDEFMKQMLRIYPEGVVHVGG